LKISWLFDVIGASNIAATTARTMVDTSIVTRARPSPIARSTHLMRKPKSSDSRPWPRIREMKSRAPMTHAHATGRPARVRMPWSRVKAASGRITMTLPNRKASSAMTAAGMPHSGHRRAGSKPIQAVRLSVGGDAT
jgi:hypothetical protein